VGRWAGDWSQTPIELDQDGSDSLEGQWARPNATGP